MMAASNNEQTVMNPHNACFDPLDVDVDSMINYDQLRGPSPTHSSSSSSSRSHSTARPSSETANPNNTLLPPSSQNAYQQIFSAPSHQYDLHKQQTPLPMGAVANTLAVNDQNGLRYQPSIATPTNDAFFGTSPAEDFLDLNANLDSQASYGRVPEMDMDYGSSASEGLPAFFFPEPSPSQSSTYIEPNALATQDPHQQAASTVSQQGATNRPWPGMHQQEAAMLKAQQRKMALQHQRHQQHQQHQHHQQQQQQQQQQLRHRNQLVQQQHQRQSSQSRRARAVSQSTAPAQSNALPPPTDAMVEAKISRLLSSMRQASNSEDASSQDDSMLPHVARMRKDEEDMDEDERLLASEEGKKLSSKERRQLRNKVSARAFRSRRKEYIGQLENELAGKAQESNELRAQNHALRHENTQLTSLSSMLLRMPAFKQALDTMTEDNGMLSPLEALQASQATPSQKSRASAAPMRKDANPYLAAQRQSQQSGDDEPHIGMALLPDNAVDFSTLNLDADNVWADGNLGAGSWAAPQHQVYSLHDVTEGPPVDHLDANSLSGKSSDFIGSVLRNSSTKQDMPDVEPMPTVPEQLSTERSKSPQINFGPVDFDDSDPAFALFADSPSQVTVDAQKDDLSEQSARSSKIILSHKLSSADTFSNPPSTDGQDVLTSDAAYFTRILRSTEAALHRLEKMTAHL